MFNPNSAFPRQTTYVPYTGGFNGIARAINAPNFAPKQASGFASFHNLRGA